MLKRKSVAIESNELELFVTVVSADGLPPTYPVPNSSRIYRVKFWVGSNQEPCLTKIVQGKPDPQWKETFKITLDKSMNHKFLHVKVLRIRSERDSAVAGTSNDDDMISVGRACIPLPDMGSKKAKTIDLVKKVARVGRFVLVRLEEKGYIAEGFITICVELSKKSDD